MRVYRVQDQDGAGPYTKDITWAILNNSEISTDWPTHGSLPWDDESQDRLRFGFSSTYDLTRWFNPSQRRALAEQGFKATVWDAPDDAVIPGRKQVAFYADRAQLVEELPLTEVVA